MFLLKIKLRAKKAVIYCFFANRNFSRVISLVSDRLHKFRFATVTTLTSVALFCCLWPLWFSTSKKKLPETRPQKQVLMVILSRLEGCEVLHGFTNTGMADQYFSEWQPNMLKNV